MTSRVPSVEPPSMMICSISGYVWEETEDKQPAMVADELKVAVMIENFKVKF